MIQSRQSKTSITTNSNYQPIVCVNMLSLTISWIKCSEFFGQTSLQEESGLTWYSDSFSSIKVFQECVSSHQLYNLLKKRLNFGVILISSSKFWSCNKPIAKATCSSMMMLIWFQPMIRNLLKVTRRLFHFLIKSDSKSLNILIFS